jgi:pimeloyl-ACP methyl ester carboxylesterase
MSEPLTSFVSSKDGVEVAIHDYGGQGHPTIFVHGTGLTSRMWEPIIERLGADFRAICVDLRAHGATTNPLDINFFDHRMVADLSAAADALALKDAWVVGHSMGGATGILASKRRRTVFSSRAEVIERYASRAPLDELHPECLEAYVQHGFIDRPDGSVELACSPALESKAYEQFLQQGWGQLPDVSIAVLVAYGARGSDRPSAEAQSIAERIPSGVIEVFEDSDHFGCFGPLEDVTASIRNWFTGTPS